MELVCALVLALVSLVTATPHGYGVKGGALAKADASAVAGAYGGDFGAIPLSIPNGASISGSYSKSSASSFASSSASSSSSSFSYSGSGPEAVRIEGSPGASGIAATGNTGCTSGDCQSSQGNVLPGILSGAGNGQALSGTKAGAVSIAGSNSYSTSGTQAPCTSGDCHKTTTCQGTNCDNSSSDNKCTSSHCEPASQTGSLTTDYGSKNKCSSGQCGPTSSVNEANDIPVNIAGSSGSKSTYKSNIQSSNYDKSNEHPSAPGVEAHNKPATFLTAPKQDTPCTSPNCGTSGSVYDNNKPSSYNVPFHSTLTGPSSQNQGSCISGNCGNNLPNTPKTTYQEPSGSSGPDNCAAGNCAGFPAPQGNTGLLSKGPSYSHGSSTSYAPAGSAESTNCKTPNCARTSSSQASKYPSYAQTGTATNLPPINAGASTGANAIAGSFVALKPNENTKQPVYNGGFGGPSGILKPNDYTIPSNTLSSSYQPPAPTGIYNPSACSSGNCGSASIQPTSVSGTSSGVLYTAPSGTYNHVPCSPGNCGHHIGQSIPHYNPSGPSKPTVPTSGFGGSIGILKPNEFSSPSILPTTNYKPTPAGTYNPACSSGNCGHQSVPSVSSPQYDQNSLPTGAQYKPPAPAGTYNPVFCPSGICESQSDQSIPQYSPSSPSIPIAPTSGFGGPTGIPKPNEFSTPSKAPTSNYKPTAPAPIYSSSLLPQYDHGSLPSGAQYQPTPPTGAGSKPCSSVICGSQSAKISPAYGQSGFSKPSAQSGAYIPVSCTSGNCGPQFSQTPHYGQPAASASGSHYDPTPLAGSHNPTICSSGNCGAQSDQSTSQYGHKGVSQAPSQYGQTGLANGAQYQPTPPAAADIPISCSAGNCGPQSGHSTPQYGHIGATNGVHVGGTAVASANAVAYTGGFGGPPGLLKPFDDSKFGSGAGTTGMAEKLPVGAQANNAHYGTAPGSGSPSSNVKSLNGAGSSPLAGTGAKASAVAGATAYSSINNKPGAYNARAGDLGGADNSSGGCKGGCGPNGGGNNSGYNGGLPNGLSGFNLAGASAKSVANAGAGSFGLGGGYASSSASAHASAGAATKGGYGRR